MPTNAAPQKRSIVTMLQSYRASIDTDSERKLIDFVSQARETIDIAMYDLRSRPVLDVLHALTQRIRVRIIIDAGTAGRSGVPALDPKTAATVAALADAGLSANVTALYPQGERAMHHKFVVRDNAAVWTGGMNCTDGGLHLEDAAAITLKSEPLAKVYTAEFERLLSGATRITTPPQPMIVGKEHQVTALFGPDIKAAVLTALAGNVKRLCIFAYAISDTDFLRALMRFKTNARDIRGIYDPHGMQVAANACTEAEELFWFCDDPRFMRAPSNPFSRFGESNALSHKALLVNDMVFIGSWNFCNTLETVDDNVLHINSPQVATALTRYFDILTTRYRNYA